LLIDCQENNLYKDTLLIISLLKRDSPYLQKLETYKSKVVSNLLKRTHHSYMQ